MRPWPLAESGLIEPFAGRKNEFKLLLNIIRTRIPSATGAKSMRKGAKALFFAVPGSCCNYVQGELRGLLAGGL